ncbi:MAG: hypothetical protein ABR505_05225 [Actinomycetota bacterium]
MRLLFVFSHAGGGQRQREHRGIVLAAVILLMSTPVPYATLQAEAAFPGRNGRIAFAVPAVDHSATRDLLGGGVNRDLYVVDWSTGVLTQLTEGPEEDWCPAWSPRGDRIAFGRRIGLGAGDLFVLDVKTGRITNVSTTPDSNEFYPAWSPDGRRIVFASDRGNPAAYPFIDMDLYVVDMEGEVTQLVDMDGVQAMPAWSPQGDVIAFQDRATNSIRLVPATGGHAVMIAQSEDEPGGPSWSPDGRQLAFATTTGDLWVVNRGGSGLYRLSGLPSVHSNPSWSPDGKWIAFVGASRDEERQKLYRVRPDGSRIEPIIAINLGPDPFATVDWGPRP